MSEKEQDEEKVEETPETPETTEVEEKSFENEGGSVTNIDIVFDLPIT